MKLYIVRIADKNNNIVSSGSIRAINGTDANKKARKKWGTKYRYKSQLAHKRKK